jgi:hypothetical protein
MQGRPNFGKYAKLTHHTVGGEGGSGYGRGRSAICCQCACHARDGRLSLRGRKFPGVQSERLKTGARIRATGAGAKLGMKIFGHLPKLSRKGT